jgi:hypothetical protein
MVDGWAMSGTSFSSRPDKQDKYVHENFSAIICNNNFYRTKIRKLFTNLDNKKAPDFSGAFPFV